MMLQQQRQNLDTLLTTQISQPELQNYALALNAARHDTPSITTLDMLQILIDREGDKWLQVINRLSEREFDLVCEKYVGQFKLYIGFVSNLSKHSNWQALISILMQQIETHQQIAPKIIFETAYLLLHRLQQFDILPIELSSQAFINYLGTHSSSIDNHYLECIYYVLKGQEKNDTSQRTHLKLFLVDLLQHLAKGPLTCESIRVLAVACQSFLAFEWFNRNALKLAGLIVTYLKEFTENLRKETEIEEIINYQEDVNRGKESMTIYTLAAHLLQVLAEDVDGLLSALMKDCLKNIRVIFTTNRIQQATAVSVDIISVLELSYLTLNILSPQISKRSDLLDQIVSFFEEHHKSVFIPLQSKITNLRSIRLIGAFSNCLFGIELQSALNYILTYIKQAPLSLQGQQSCQTMELLVQSDQLYTRLEGCVYELSAIIYSIMQKSPSERFFQLLAIFMKRFNLFIEKYCVSVVGRLVDRINLSAQNKSYQLAMRCFDCLEAILNCQDVVKDLYDSFDKHLERLCHLLQNPELSEIFEGKVFLLASILINDTKELTNFVQGCIVAVEAIYQRTQCISDLAEIIYSCCVYVKDQILQKQNLIIGVFSRTLLSFLHKPNNQEQFVKACYLTQLLLQSFELYYTQKSWQHQRCILELSNVNFSELTNQKSKIAFHGVLISLANIRHFTLPRITTHISKFPYDNKLYLIYYSIILSQSFNPQLFSEFLGYCRAYIASNTGQKMESEEFNRDYLQEWIESLKLPYIKIDEWKILQTSLNELADRGFLPDLATLTESQVQTLKDIKKMQKCEGGIARKIVKVR